MQIKKKLSIIFNVLICVPLGILAIITYVYSSNLTVSKSKKNMEQLVVLEGRVLHSLIEAKKNEVKLLVSDKVIINYMESTKDRDNSDKVKQYLQGFLVDDEDNEVILFDEKEKFILTTEKVMSTTESQPEVHFSDKVSLFIDDDKTINITASIKNQEGETLGFICKRMGNDVFREFTNMMDVNETGYAFIIDGRDHIITHPDQSLESLLLPNEILRNEINKSRAQNEIKGTCTYLYEYHKKYASYYIVEEIDWVICLTQSVEQMQRQAFVGSIFIVGTMLVIMILVSIVSKIVSRYVTRPIELLMEAMSGVSEGDFSKYCTYSGKNEFGVLSKNYNQMLTKLGESYKHLNEVYEELVVTKYELESNYTILEKSKEALALSEARYKITLNAIEEVIWEYDVGDKSFSATDNWEMIIGNKEEGEDVLQIINKVVKPQDLEKLMKIIECCKKGEVNDFSQQILITKNNQECWLVCKGHVFANEQGEIQKIVGILTDITYNKNNEEQVRKLRFFDELTGCLNKATFIESLEAWVSSNEEIKESALLFIDLDDFKNINDTLSHELGDQVLHFVGKMLREILPQDTFVGRFGGDEFVIFKTTISGVEEIQELIYLILNMFQNKIEIKRSQLHLTCSIGIAMYPENGQDSVQLLKNADTAMYQAKSNGKNTYSFYTPAMTQMLDRKLLIEKALREARSRELFYLLYQPVVDAQTGKTLGCEALLRLKDHEIGLVSPAEFIPIAEERDLIIQTGDWVLENALNTLHYYHKQGYTNFTMNINVSSIQIRQGNFLDKLKQAIKKAEVPTGCIKLEVTESVLIENIEESIQLFNEVKALGIQIALDDFGTSYSSLNYLRSIPLDILKIDKTFVDEITTSKVLSEIVDSIINMAHALDILVVAEGVENQMQLEVLQEKGCDFIQGYHFSKPLYKNELEKRLGKENR